MQVEGRHWWQLWNAPRIEALIQYFSRLFPLLQLDPEPLLGDYLELWTSWSKIC